MFMLLFNNEHLPAFIFDHLNYLVLLTNLHFLPLCNASVWRWPNAVITGALFQRLLRISADYARVSAHSHTMMCYDSGFLCSCALLLSPVIVTLRLSQTRK